MDTSADAARAPAGAAAGTGTGSATLGGSTDDDTLGLFRVPSEFRADDTDGGDAPAARARQARRRAAAALDGAAGAGAGLAVPLPSVGELPEHFMPPSPSQDAAGACRTSRAAPCTPTHVRVSVSRWTTARHLGDATCAALRR